MALSGTLKGHTVESAKALIETEIGKAEKLLSQDVTDESYRRQTDDFDLWATYVKELLRSLFTTDEFSEEFTNAKRITALQLGAGLRVKARMQDNRISACIQYLRQLCVRLPFLQDNETPASDRDSAQPSPAGIFIVHGHNKALKFEVARFMEKLEVGPIILDEQANEGKTIIEKLERYSNVQFAIVMLTADDEGRGKDSQSPLVQRARQNVWFEFGYFASKLGRAKVCALVEKEVEIPSDLQGVGYVQMDGDWKFDLVREMKAAGIPVDMNKAVVNEVEYHKPF